VSIDIPAKIAAGEVREYVADVLYPHFIDKKSEYDHIKHWATGVSRIICLILMLRRRSALC